MSANAHQRLHGRLPYGVKLHVWGPYACFARPEFKAERVSYDVITPSAARGILEAIHWKPGIRWVVDRVHVLNPVRFETVCRNEVGAKGPGSRRCGCDATGHDRRAATSHRGRAPVPGDDAAS